MGSLIEDPWSVGFAPVLLTARRNHKSDCLEKSQKAIKYVESLWYGVS